MKREHSGRLSPTISRSLTIFGLFVGLVLTPNIAGAHSDHATAEPAAEVLAASSVSLEPFDADITCPEMTDSVVRLYAGYFDREPSLTEFNALVDRYRSGTGLRQLSLELLESTEFIDEHETLTDTEYIDLVFENTVEREPSEPEQSQWQAALESSDQRELMMLTFTESAEFVAQTQTTRPLAGHGRWYPEGVHWYCGRGSDRFPIQPLTGQNVSSDFIFVNSGVQSSLTEMWVLEANFNRNVQMTSGSIPPNFSDFNWDGLFSGDGNFGENLDIQTSDSTRWVVAFYPTSIGDKRTGWELQTS